MKIAEKCPKCGGKVQVKSIRKSFGLGFVNIPVAQFCLNPVCDWYQDFSEAMKPEDFKKNGVYIKIPSFKNEMPKRTVILGGIIAVTAIIAIFLLINPFPQQQQPQPRQSEAAGTNTSVVDTMQIPAGMSAPAVMQVMQQLKNYSIKMDVAHGFNPKIITINQSDTVVWNNEENQRTRIVLRSMDGLFEDSRMEYTDKFSYRFNNTGNYSFVLTEYPSLNEYPDAIGRVIVK